MAHLISALFTPAFCFRVSAFTCVPVKEDLRELLALQYTPLVGTDVREVREHRTEEMRSKDDGHLYRI